MTDWQDWVGREQQRDDLLHSFPARALAATLGRHDLELDEGDALPPLWHWLYFLDTVPTDELGEDGHPRRGGFLPPVELPRRMWAGSELRFHRAPQLGERLCRYSRIDSVTAKQGRSGGLVFVTLDHRLCRGDELLLEERQDLVYRGASAPASPTMDAPSQPQWSRHLVPDPVLLFRYSALTFNGHRIHYDQPYAQAAEGYPALVVQGPLTATLLLDALQREHPGARLATFRFRGLAPLYSDTPLQLQGRIEGNEVEMWALDGRGGLAMQASATLL